MPLVNTLPSHPLLNKPVSISAVKCIWYMVSERTKEILDYCCILLHDRIQIEKKNLENDYLVELFIRNSLQIPSTTRVKQYFQENFNGKSAICEFDGSTPRQWCRFHNKLKKERNGCMHLIPFTKQEQSDIKDIRYVKYRILAYEVEHKINDLDTFDMFLKNKLCSSLQTFCNIKGDNLTLKLTNQSNQTQSFATIFQKF